jgi:hypothetical protein
MPASSDRQADWPNRSVEAAPSAPALRRLRRLVTAVVRDGLDTVLTQGRRQHTVEQLVRNWPAQPSRAQPFTRLEADRGRLCDDEVAGPLAGSGEPIAQRHAAVLTLPRTMPVGPSRPRATSSRTPRRPPTTPWRRWSVPVQVSDRRHRRLSGGPRRAGNGLRAASGPAPRGGRTERAVQGARNGAAASTPVRRRARTVNLTRFAAHGDPSRRAGVKALVETLNTGSEQA